MLKRRVLLWFILLFISFSTHAATIRIVAAENMYGQIAEQLGGPYVEVTSILKNPNQDPHLFSNTPKTAKAIAKADIIIYNGLDYDAWIDNLVSADSKKKHIINIAELLNKKPGDNPHIWYSPKTMLAYAEKLTALLSQLDPDHQHQYQTELNTFKQKYATLIETMNDFKNHFKNTPIIATEPVFNEMAQELGLIVEGQGFQLSVMNGAEPSIRDIKDFEEKLKNHQVKVLIFNNQVSNPLTERMQKLATTANIPSVGVSETEPANQDYFAWMTSQLSALKHALGE